MKILVIPVLAAATIFLAGCETNGDDRRDVHSGATRSTGAGGTGAGGATGGGAGSGGMGVGGAAVR